MSLSKYDAGRHFLGRDLTDLERRTIDPVPEFPEPPLQLDPEFDPCRKNCLLLTSCYAYQLRHYLKTKPEFVSDYNINIMLVHVMLIGGYQHGMPELFHAVIRESPMVLSHELLGPYKPLDIREQPELKNRVVIFFPPPTNNAVWPISMAFGSLELQRAYRGNRTKEDIWRAFKDGDFDPCFDERWSSEMQWMRKREETSQIKIAEFCERNIKVCKLWFTENHPTYTLLAWVGSEFLRLIGRPCDSEHNIRALPLDALGTWGVHPETKYEFQHFGFTYPMRYQNEDGGLEYYRKLIMDSTKVTVDRAFPIIE